MKNEEKKPGPLTEENKAQFNLLLEAAHQGCLAVMSCVDRETGKEAPVVTVITQDEETGDFIAHPVAVLAMYFEEGEVEFMDRFIPPSGDKE